MGSNGTSSTSRQPGPPHRAGRRLAALLGLLPLVAGCETLTRMDYLDRYFEPRSVTAPAPLAEPVPPPVTADAGPAALPVPEPEPAPVTAMEPRPNPPPRPAASQAPPAAVRPESEEEWLRVTLRRNQWLTRFWSELTPAQQRRVGDGLKRSDVWGEAAPAWDSMGLSDRTRLVFGGGRGAGSAWAGSP